MNVKFQTLVFKVWGLRGSRGGGKDVATYFGLEVQVSVKGPRTLKRPKVTPPKTKNSLELGHHFWKKAHFTSKTKMKSFF